MPSSGSLLVFIGGTTHSQKGRILRNLQERFNNTNLREKLHIINVSQYFLEKLIREANINDDEKDNFIADRRYHLKYYKWFLHDADVSKAVCKEIEANKDKRVFVINSHFAMEFNGRYLMGLGAENIRNICEKVPSLDKGLIVLIDSIPSYEFLREIFLKEQKAESLDRLFHVDKEIRVLAQEDGEDRQKNRDYSYTYFEILKSYLHTRKIAYLQLRDIGTVQQMSATLVGVFESVKYLHLWVELEDKEMIASSIRSVAMRIENEIRDFL